jgi:hypothetical protein
MTENSKYELLDQAFKTEVTDRKVDVDPGEKEDWFSLALGWAIAKGLRPENAHDFALHIRYHTDLG